MNFKNIKMEKKYEISLINQHTFEYITTYEWYEIPQKQDSIHIKENEIFIVLSRLLPMTDSNRVVLFGNLAKMGRNGEHITKL